MVYLQLSHILSILLLKVLSKTMNKIKKIKQNCYQLNNVEWRAFIKCFMYKEYYSQRIAAHCMATQIKSCIVTLRTTTSRGTSALPSSRHTVPIDSPHYAFEAWKSFHTAILEWQRQAIHMFIHVYLIWFAMWNYPILQLCIFKLPTKPSAMEPNL